MAKTKARISRNRDFLGVAPLQTHTHTDRQRTDRPGSPPPRAGNLHPVGGLSPPHSNELLRPLAKGAYFGSTFFARATIRLTTWSQAPEKNGTSSFSASAFAWAVPGTGLALWAPPVLGRGYPLFGPKTGRKFRNAQKRFLSSKNGLLCKSKASLKR